MSSGKNIVGRQIRLTLLLVTIFSIAFAGAAMIGNKPLLVATGLLLATSPYISIVIIMRQEKRSKKH